MANTIADWVGMELDGIAEEELFKHLFPVTALEKNEDTFYLTNPGKGIELVISKVKVVTTVHLFSGQEYGYGLFDEEMPFNLSFSFRKEDLRGLFGDPDRTGGGYNALYLGYVDPWEKFYLSPHTIHVVYKEGGHIAKISIGLLSMENYFNSSLQ